MCVAFPGKIVEINSSDNAAIVDVFGAKKKIFLELLDDEVTIGDYVISHAGFAIQKVDREEALETLKLVGEIVGK